MANNTSTAYLENSVGGIALTMAGPSLELVSSIGSLIVLHTILKDLHQVMKTTLTVLSVHNIISSIGSISTLGYMHGAKDQSLETCTMMVQTILPSFCITCESFSLLSYIRHHIASKTQKLEALKVRKITLLAVAMYLSEHSYIPFSYFLTDFFNLPSGSSACAGKDLNGPPIITAFNAIRVMSVFGFGIAYDVKLMKFIRQRKQQKSPGHVQLVPWKSGPPEKNDVTVPLSASIANSIFLVIAFCVAVWSIITYRENDSATWKLWPLTYCLTMSLQMPIILGLTFRVTKHKKPPPVIPNKPMFHNDPYLNTPSPEPNEVQLQEQLPVIPEEGPQLQPHQGSVDDPDVPIEPQSEPTDEQKMEANNPIESSTNNVHVRIIYVRPHEGECSCHM